MTQRVTPAIPLEELRRAYQALGELPLFPGDSTWIDRLVPFEDFLVRGPQVAGWFLSMRRPDPAMVAMAPELYELLIRAFPTGRSTGGSRR